ncbi:hypothetical protein IKJ53_06220 [bacterium]|nr:hypothetical protein [bacterium]
MMRPINNISTNFYLKSQSEAKAEVKKETSSTNNFTSYDKAISFYGQAFVQSTKKEPTSQYVEFTQLCDEIETLDGTEEISLEDAVKAFDNTPATDAQKLNYILAATYEDTSEVPTVNKKALLVMKQDIFFGKKTPKMEDVIRTCLDEKERKFNYDKFHGMFNVKGNVKITARLKPRPQNFAKEERDAKSHRRMAIIHAIDNNSANKEVEVNIENSDYFKPLNDIAQNLYSDLDNLKEDEKSIPEDLYNSMKTAISNGNFDMKSVFRDYYSLLSNCKDLKDVKEMYPHLEYPTEKPEYNPHRHKYAMDNKLAESDFDKVILNILHQGYQQLKNETNIHLEFENNRPSDYKNFVRAGYEVTLPSEKMLNFLDKSEKIDAKYRTLPDLKDEEIDELAKKHATRISGVWSDFTNRAKGKWLPIKFIENKKRYPDTTKYTTEKVVDSFLMNLYEADKNKEYSANPLEKFDDKNYLMYPMMNVINGAYRNIYNLSNTDFYKKSKDAEFIAFKEKFDTKAIAKSFEHIEKKYTNSFYRQYWTEKRSNKVKDALTTSYDLIYEKLIHKDDVSKKSVKEKVKNAIEEMDSRFVPNRADEEKVSKLRYIASTVQNPLLKERLQYALPQSENINADYFETTYEIISKSMSNNSLDEDKAYALINIHDKYVNTPFEIDSIPSEESFVMKTLERYKTESDYNYKRYIEDSKQEFEYFNQQEQLEKFDEYGLGEFIENELILNQKEPKYKLANLIIKDFLEIPSVLREKYAKTAINSKNENIITTLRELDKLHSQTIDWNFDNDEIIVMDKETVPQLVVITQKAKNDLWKLSGENIKLFDRQIKKFYTSASKRTSKSGGNGIKEFDKNTSEIKILGEGGYLRMYSRPVTPNDIAKYKNDTGLNVKYIFDVCEFHT